MLTFCCAWTSSRVCLGLEVTAAVLFSPVVLVVLAPVPLQQNDHSGQTVKILVDQCFALYHAPKEVHSDVDVHIWTATGLYKRVLDALNIQVTSSVPYPHTSNPLCEAQNGLVEQILTMLMKQERTKDWVRLLPCDVLTMTSRQRSSTAYSPHDLFHWGRPAWLFKTFLTLRITIAP